MMLLKLLLSLVAVYGSDSGSGEDDDSSSVTLAWVNATSRVGGKQTCAGIIMPCGDQVSCTTTAIGPCNSSASEISATQYIKTYLIGMAYVDEAKYLSCADETNCADMKIMNAISGVGFRDVSSTTGQYGYSYTMTGRPFGATDGAYLGVATYLNTGTGDIVVSENDFYLYIPNSGVSSEGVSRGDSTMGAPQGPVKACIADMGANGACTGTRKFTPAASKFSIFAFTYGDNYATTYKAGVNGFPNPMTHMAIRTHFKCVGFAPTGLKIVNMNEEVKSLDTIGNDDVFSFSVTMDEGGSLDYSFPQEYNWGDTANYTVGSDTALPLSGVGSIKIKIKPIPDSGDSIYIDYLIDFAHIKDGSKYAVYDPTSTTDGTKGGAVTKSNKKTNFPTWAIVISVVLPVLFCVALVGVFLLMQKKKSPEPKA